MAGLSSFNFLFIIYVYGPHLTKEIRIKNYIEAQYHKLWKKKVHPSLSLTG